MYSPLKHNVFILIIHKMGNGFFEIYYFSKLFVQNKTKKLILLKLILTFNL